MTAVEKRLTRGLRMLRDDLWTVRADPLPPSVWLRWLLHGVLCLAAFGITAGGAADLQGNGSLGATSAFVIALAQGGAVLLGMWRPIPAWWLSTGATVVGAIALRSQGGSQHSLITTTPSPVVVPGTGGGPEGMYTWPWTVAGIIAQLLVLLLLALRVRTRVSVEALVLTVLATYVLEGLWGGAHYQSTGVLATVLCTVVVVLGTALRGRREARSQLVEQTSLTAEERARRTLLEERSRIARELHDVVAHHMSVISIQAQVAPHLVADPPEELKENLAGIRQNALEALTELRRVLGVLRSENPENPEDPYGIGAAPSGSTPHAPQPTLDRLDALIENTRAAGLEVTTEITGERLPLPPGVELSAYRIVQEALSNVLRHAPGASVRVELTHYPRGLQVRVINSGPDLSPGAGSGRAGGAAVPETVPGAGHGLLGMRERAAMLGGTLATHVTACGGFVVAAFLPRTGNAAPDSPADPLAETSPGDNR